MLKHSLNSHNFCHVCLFLPWRNSPCGLGPVHYRGSTITLRHTTLGRNPLEEESARRRDLYLATQFLQATNIHDPSGIQIRNPSKRAAANPRLEQAATGIGHVCLRDAYFVVLLFVKKVTLSVEQKFGGDRLVHRYIVTNHVTGRNYAKINSLLHQNIKRQHLHIKTNGCHSLVYKFVSAITLAVAGAENVINKLE